MKICLDPGHGGKDRWNVGPTGYVEADGVLDIALIAGKILESHDVEVVYTRTTDMNLYWESDQWRDLRSRANFANGENADYYISIHSNANPDSTANGTETFCLSKGGEGETLAECIQKKLINDLGLKNRGVKEGNFAVLRLTNMPAALTEVAFHTNLEEEKLLLDSEFRNKVGTSIAKGILEFINVPYEIEEEKPWEQVAGENAIDDLAKDDKLSNPEMWKSKDLVNEATPLWLFFEMLNRINKI